MPRLPKNMVHRTDRGGFFFRHKRNGKSTWIALGEDYTEACRQLRILKNGGPKPVTHWTVKDAAAEWLRTYVPNARSRYGVKQTGDRLEEFLIPFLGHRMLSKVGSQDLHEYRRWLEAKGRRPRAGLSGVKETEHPPLSPATVKHVLSDARCFLNWAENAGYIVRSPFPKRIMPRLQERPPDRLTDEEVAAVANIAEPHGFVVRFALATGLRWGELTRAQPSDVQNGALVVHQTKSGRVRRVPIPKWFAPELPHRSSQLVPFSSPGQFNSAVQRMSRVWRFHVHQLRHTFACQWLERGGSLAALQQVLGHSSIVTTQRYARLSDDMVMREAERIEGPGVPEGVPGRRALQIQAVSCQKDGGIAKW